MSKYPKEEIKYHKLDLVLPINIHKEHSDYVSNYFKKEQLATNVKKKINKCSTLIDKQEQTIDIVMTTEMKVQITDDHKYQLSIIVLTPPEEPPMSSVIDPNGAIYLTWMMVVSSCLVLVLIILPYNMLFHADDIGMFDYVTDSIFITDIILSFNVGQYENDDDEEYIADRYKISYV